MSNQLLKTQSISKIKETYLLCKLLVSCGANFYKELPKWQIVKKYKQAYKTKNRSHSYLWILEICKNIAF